MARQIVLHAFVKGTFHEPIGDVVDEDENCDIIEYCMNLLTSFKIFGVQASSCVCYGVAENSLVRIMNLRFLQNEIEHIYICKSDDVTKMKKVFLKENQKKNVQPLQQVGVSTSSSSRGRTYLGKTTQERLEIHRKRKLDPEYSRC